MDDKIKDADYKEVDEKIKNIRGKALYFSTSQVANILEQPDSKIRYYTTVFNDILNIEISNKQRRYTEQDIDKLRFIIKLKNEGLTIKQISEYSENVDFEGEDGKIQIKESNPLAIKTLAAALLEEQNKQLQNFKQDLLDQMDDKIKQYLFSQEKSYEKNIKQLKQDVAITVDEIVTEHSKQTLETQDKQLQSFISELNEKQSEIAITSEDQRKNIIEKIDRFNELTKGIDKNQEKALKKLIDLSNTTSRMEQKRNEEESKKETGLFSKIKSIFKNKNEKE